MDLESTISQFVEKQFPAFYAEEGPNFILFLKAYYAWMEQEGGATKGSRELLTNLDVDKSIDSFISHFRSQYLVDLPSSDRVSEAFRIKHIQDLYKSKGTSEGMELFFRLFYRSRATIVKPGDNILRASDGKWIVPIYLELDYDENNTTFIGRKITGATSGATAIVESFARRLVNGRIIDVMYLSNLRGNFQVNEYITNTGSLVGAPRIVGSMTSASITNGGFGISNGDVFNITSEHGNGGAARVVVTVNGSGQVQFNLADGGSGYSTTNTTVTVSNAVSFHGGNTVNANNFTTTEFVVQNNFVFSTANTLNIANGSLVQLYNTAPALIGNGVVFSINSSSVSVSVSNGNIASAASLALASNTAINVSVSSPVFTTANAIVMATNSIAIGLSNVNGTFQTGGFMRGATSNCLALAVRLSRGANASFTIGAVSNTEIVSGQTIGNILTLGSINPGIGYDTPPMVTLTNQTIASGLKYDWTVSIANTSGTFIAGQRAVANSGIGGTIRSVNTTSIELRRKFYGDTLANNQQIVSYHANGVISGIATISGVANNTLYLMGNNAVVTTNATSLSGVVNEVEITNSGLGYVHDEVLTFTSIANSSISFTGSANILRQGKGPGFWTDNRGKLNSDKYVQDSDYYQEYSYEVQTDISIDKYADVFKKIMHIAGNKLFGAVAKQPAQDVRLQSSGSYITFVNSDGSTNWSVVGNATAQTNASAGGASIVSAIGVSTATTGAAAFSNILTVGQADGTARANTTASASAISTARSAGVATGQSSATSIASSISRGAGLATSNSAASASALSGAGGQPVGLLLALTYATGGGTTVSAAGNAASTSSANGAGFSFSGGSTTGQPTGLLLSLTYP